MKSAISISTHTNDGRKDAERSRTLYPFRVRPVSVVVAIRTRTKLTGGIKAVMTGWYIRLRNVEEL